MPGAGRFVRVGGVAVVLVMASLFAVGVLPRSASAYTPHPPISIVGNAGFNSTNGVIRGTGTVSNPYVISGWEVNASSASGIVIRNTDAAFVVSDVYVHGNRQIDGIRLENVTNGRVENAVASEIYRGLIAAYSTNVTLARNRVSSTAAESIIIFSSTRAAVRDNNLSSGGLERIRISSSGYVVVAGNLVSSGGPGILLDGSRDVAAMSNDLTNVGDGIYAAGSTNVTVAGNRVSNSASGVNVADSANFTVAGNTVAGNGVGIRVDRSREGQIIRNNVSSNTYDGILLGYSENLTVAGNNVTVNGPGIRLESSSAIRVHHNNLVSNTVQAVDNGAGENSWDDGYPGGGNFWADYGGVDSCSGPGQNVCVYPDGIGDTPYGIDADSRDTYPLMAAYVPRNAPPSASFHVFPATGSPTTVFAMDAAPSWDAEDPVTALQVRWDWEGDGTWDTPWTATRIAYHVYGVPGAYTVRLEVRDTGGLTNTSAIAVTVLVEPPPPLAPIVAVLLVLVPPFVAVILLVLWSRRRRGRTRATPPGNPPPGNP